MNNEPITFHFINETNIRMHLKYGVLDTDAYNVKVTDITIRTGYAPEDTEIASTIYVITDHGRVDKKTYDIMKSHIVPIWYLSTSGVNSQQVLLPEFMQEDLHNRIVSRNISVGGQSELRSAIEHIAAEQMNEWSNKLPFESTGQSTEQSIHVAMIKPCSCLVNRLREGIPDCAWKDGTASISDDRGNVTLTVVDADGCFTHNKQTAKPYDLLIVPHDNKATEENLRAVAVSGIPILYMFTKDMGVVPKILQGDNVAANSLMADPVTTGCELVNNLIDKVFWSLETLGPQLAKPIADSSWYATLSRHTVIGDWMVGVYTDPDGSIAEKSREDLPLYVKCANREAAMSFKREFKKFDPGARTRSVLAWFLTYLDEFPDHDKIQAYTILKDLASYFVTDKIDNAILEDIIAFCNSS